MRTAYLDTETHLIAPGRLAPRLVCVQVAEDGGEVVIHLATDPRTRAVVERVLTAEYVVGHNVAYDLAVLGQAYPDLLPAIWRAYDEGRVCDTMICAQMVDIARGRLSGKRGAYALKTLYNRATDCDLAKGEDSWQLRYAELDGVAVDLWPEDARTYATLDVQATRAVWLWLIAPSDNPRLPPTYAVQVRAAWALHLASCWGMRCDPAAVARLRADLDRTQRELREKLVAAGMLRADGTRDDTAVRTYAERAGVTKRTATGKVSVTAAALQDVDDPVLGALAEYLHAAKLRSTYLPVVERGCREPIQPRYGLVESGRTSCSGPNLQNLPRSGAVRECFVPRPGHVYVAADYSVIELVCLAQVLAREFGLENSRMAQAICDGLDLHILTASHILASTYDETLARYKTGDKHVKETRQLAKGLSFGIPGGLGAEKLRQLLRGYGHEVTVDQARLLKERWLQLFPEMRLFFGNIANTVASFPDGEARVRHPITGFLRGGLDYCSAANHMFQHLAAFGAKTALYAVQRACFSSSGPLAGARLVAFVHDEFILEVPEACCDAAARELVDIMCAEFSFAVPDIPVKSEALAMRRWCKAACAQYDSAGKLVPWGEP